MDFYKHRLAHARWTWREGRGGRYHKSPRNKDRASGRAEKARARTFDRLEIDDQRRNALHPAELRLIEDDAKDRDG